MGEAVPALANGVCFDERYSALAVVLKEGLPPMPAATPSRRSPTWWVSTASSSRPGVDDGPR